MSNPSITIRSMDEPDLTRDAPNEHVDVLTVGDTTIGRVTAQPGWRWSESFGAESCDEAHAALYVVSGRMGIRMNDGTEVEVGPGNFFYCPPGHDSWTLGDEPVVFLDVKPAAD